MENAVDLVNVLENLYKKLDDPETLNKTEKEKILDDFWSYYHVKKRHNYHEVTLFILDKEKLDDKYYNEQIDLFTAVISELADLAKSKESECKNRENPYCCKKEDNFICEEHEGSKCYYCSISKCLYKLYDHILLEVTRLAEIKKANKEYELKFKDADKRFEEAELEFGIAASKFDKADKKLNYLYKKANTLEEQTSNLNEKTIEIKSILENTQKSMEDAQNTLKNAQDSMYEAQNTLESTQNKFEDMETNLESTQEKLSGMQVTIEETKKRLEDTQKEYITILGIFSSIVLAFIGGMIFSTSVLQNIGNGSIFRILAAVLIIAFTFLNMLFILVRFISDINGLSDDKIKYTEYMKQINKTLLILLVLVILGWLIDINVIAENFRNWMNLNYH